MWRRTHLFGFALLGAITCAGVGIAQTLASTINLGNGYYFANLALRSCARKGTEIQCDFVLTSTRGPATDYKYGGPLAGSEITDDTHLNHPQVNGYFLIGKNKPSDVVTLVKDDTVEVIQIFSGVAPEVKKLHVIFSGQYITTDLN